MLAAVLGRSRNVNNSAEVTTKAPLFYLPAEKERRVTVEYLLSLVSLIRNMWKKAHPRVNSAFRKGPFLLPHVACWLK